MMTARVVLPPHRHLAPGLPPSRLLRPKGAVPKPTRVDDTRQNCDLCGTLSTTAVDAQYCTRNHCQLAAHQIARTPPCCTCSFLSCMPVKCCFHERVPCGTCSSLHGRAPFSTECATKTTCSDDVGRPATARLRCSRIITAASDIFSSRTPAANGRMIIQTSDLITGYNIYAELSCNMLCVVCSLLPSSHQTLFAGSTVISLRL